MVDLFKIRRAQKTVAAYKTAFSGDAGQTVLIDLMEKCRVTEPVTEKDPVVSAFWDGKRCAVLDIFKMIGVDEMRLIKLLQQSEEKNGN